MLAEKIIVTSIEELDKANKNAKPGDTIILKNGEWKDVDIRLSCKGSEDQPVLFTAETAGKVTITGHSKLRLGGSFIMVEGLFFTNGYAGNDAVISFRIDNKQLANNCRVTNCVIEDFNNPKRMDENNWVLFYGKRNKLDHCSFRDKKNMGVLLAVILDDDRSRDNYHSISHNYFGRRIPLASNGGEIIRVGVSQHAQFNSHTDISNNFFEHCDGETEVVSIKSGANEITENVFKECQGSVVLRHGDNNLVAGNLFIGNDKPATGGVRVINKGQRVGENIFYKCRGTDFRSPLAIMNGIPNSPAHRYVQVTDAQVMNNTFYECSPISLGEGSDAERTLPPANVTFARNTFYNTRDSIIYRAYDSISGFQFANNKVSTNVKQVLPTGFEKTNLPPQKNLSPGKGGAPEYPHIDVLFAMEKERYAASGASWFSKKIIIKPTMSRMASCRNAEEVYKQLEKKQPMTIALSGREYILDKPFVVGSKVIFTGNKQITLKFGSSDIESVFIVSGKGDLTLSGLYINATDVKATHFVSSDSNASSDHYTLSLINCTIQNLRDENGCRDLFYAYKSTIADSIVFRGNYFSDNNLRHIVMNAEKEDKGYYGAEKIVFVKNTVSKEQGTLMDIYRGGNDESTLGPDLIATDNQFIDCRSVDDQPFIKLTGVQKSYFANNSFTDCFTNTTLFSYIDKVRAYHILEKNSIVSSGKVQTNTFVTKKNNTIK
jgi:poly(beta-D-mannuronate) lyase